MVRVWICFEEGTKRFSDRLSMCCKRKKGVKGDSKVLVCILKRLWRERNWKYWV